MNKEELLKLIGKGESENLEFKETPKLNIMLKNMRTSYTPKGFEMETKTEYPIEALKEAMVNAIAHIDYHDRESILIKMFDDRIEIWSPEELLRPLTISQLMDLTYIPKSRNMNVTNVFSRRKLMDKRGTGILRMDNFCDEWKLPHPEFKEQSGYFGIIFKNPDYYTKVPRIDVENLNERQKKAIEYLKINLRISPKEYKRLFDVSDRMARYDLKDMEKKEYIIFMGSKKTSYYQLKLPNKKRGLRYVLTQKMTQKGEENE